MAKILQPNAEPIPGYRLIRYLGRGGFGEVWEAEAPGGLSKAIKLAPMENTDANLNCRELEGLQKIRSIRHPYLLSIERFEVINDGYLVIVMELADKSLSDHLNDCLQRSHQGIPRDELLRYLREASEVLDVMNQQHGLQHLDIKPENLFLSGGHMKVADFGLVQPRNTNMSTAALAISPPYAPPELFDGHIESTADQYSLAVTYQELLTGTRPYSATDVRGLILQHLKQQPDLSALPPSDRPIIAQALQRDASKRFSSCTALIEALIKAPAFGQQRPMTAPPPRQESPSDLVRISDRTVKTEEAPAAKPHFIRVAKPRDRRKVDTERISAEGTRTTNPPATQGIEVSATTNEVRATFVAFLPLELYAHKLRGFIDALDAEIISCTDEKTVLRFTSSRGWFGFRSSQKRGVFMELDSCSRLPNSGYRVVDVSVWAAGRNLADQDLGRRGMLLVHCLKGYLMATDRNSMRLLKSDSQIRAEIVD